MNVDRVRRLLEAAAQAGILLAVSALPVAWRSLDAGLTVVLLGMFAVLTAATYALHAVTFDLLRLTSEQGKGRFSYTQSKE
ncbi:hypothetical protein [Actinoplanes sp. NPDC051494]|uniref:hypothetical protein n=1 Tax=Actinoplanes sp. NPDC051494 TaxID=3363907 RepID=UPI0037B59524